MGTRARRLAPALDAACIVVFVLIGRDSHGIHQGLSWFVTVLWPLLLGWFVVAVAAHLYTRRSGSWRALAITWVGGVVVASLLRGTFTDRPYADVFTIILLTFLGALTFGWRFGARAVSTRRRHS